MMDTHRRWPVQIKREPNMSRQSFWRAMFFLTTVVTMQPATRAQDSAPETQPADPKAAIEAIRASAEPKLKRIQQEIDRRQESHPAAAQMLAKDLQRVRS